MGTNTRLITRHANLPVQVKYKVFRVGMEAKGGHECTANTASYSCYSYFFFEAYVSVYVHESAMGQRWAQILGYRHSIVSVRTP